MNLFFITCRTLNWSVLRASKGFNLAQTVSTGYNLKCQQGSGRQLKLVKMGELLRKQDNQDWGRDLLGRGEREEGAEGDTRLLTWATVVSFPERRGYQTRLELEVSTVSCCVLDVRSLRCLRDPRGGRSGTPAEQSSTEEEHAGQKVGGVTSMAVKGPEEGPGRQEDTQERTLARK